MLALDDEFKPIAQAQHVLQRDLRGFREEDLASARMVADPPRGVYCIPHDTVAFDIRPAHEALDDRSDMDTHAELKVVLREKGAHLSLELQRRPRRLQRF